MTTFEIAYELLQDENANWSLNGAYALADYYEHLEMELDESIEFDRVSIRCEFSEYASLEDWAKEYISSDWVNFFTYEDSDKAIREYIQERGQLIEFDGGVIVSQF